MAVIGPGIIIGPGIQFQSIPGLYYFTNFTFTTANIVGPSSGNLAQFKANYSNVGNTWIDSTSYYNITTPGYQTWTVPSTGTYEIEVAGSRSGNSQPAANTFGYGAIVRARVALTQGSNLTIAVGQPSANSTQVSTYASAGGGGASWVVQGNTALIVAGGGGGSAFWSSNTPTYRVGGNAVTTAWGGNSFNGAPGGPVTTLGQGGNSHVNLSGTASLNNYDGGGGGGWISNGVNGSGGNVRTNSSTGQPGGGGQGWNANLIGGVYSPTYAPPGTSSGGWGGGGGAGPISGGGGGGYSGGGGGYVAVATGVDAGGGGGSYIISSATTVATSDGNYNASGTFGGASITNIGTFNANAGYVKVTFIG